MVPQHYRLAYALSAPSAGWGGLHFVDVLFMPFSRASDEQSDVAILGAIGCFQAYLKPNVLGEKLQTEGLAVGTPRPVVTALDSWNMREQSALNGGG